MGSFFGLPASVAQRFEGAFDRFQNFFDLSVDVDRHFKFFFSLGERISGFYQVQNILTFFKKIGSTFFYEISKNIF